MMSDRTTREIERIAEYSRNWDLDGLKGIIRTYRNKFPPRIRAALTDAIGHLYGELWMSYDEGRLTGDPAENVGQIVDLLEVLKRLDPSLESEVQHSCWLRELAALHEGRDAKERYLGIARAVIDAADNRYPGDAAVRTEKILVLSDALLVPETGDATMEDVLLDTVRQALSLLTVANARGISATVHEARRTHKLRRPHLAAQIDAEFQTAVRAVASAQPNVLLIAAREFVAVWDRWDGPDPEPGELEEVDRWLLAADELPRYGPDALDMLADEVFLLASHLDPRGSRARREGYVRRALGMYERIIRDHPGFLPAYEDKARIYDWRARDLLDEGDTAGAGELLTEGITWLERVNAHEIPPRSLYESRLRLHRLYSEHIDHYRYREHNLKVAELMRKNIDERFALFRKVFHDRKRDSYAAYANRDFEDLARLQLKCGLTEAAWATVTEWNGIIREQQGLWGYVPRDIGELLKDSAFAPLRERLRRLLEENAERDGKDKELPDEEE